MSDIPSSEKRQDRPYEVRVWCSPSYARGLALLRKWHFRFKHGEWARRCSASQVQLITGVCAKAGLHGKALLIGRKPKARPQLPEPANAALGVKRDAFGNRLDNYRISTSSP